MTRRIRLKLTLIFTFIVIAIQIVLGVFLILFEYLQDSNTDYSDNLSFFLVEVVLSSIIVLGLGYYFTKLALKPTEEMITKLENFTSDASHELKTPITLALSNIELAQKTSNFEEYLPKAKNNLRTSTSLITKMLELTQINRFSIEKDNIEITTIINAILKDYEKSIKEKKIAVNLDIKENSYIKADYELLVLCLRNVIENAIKYAPRDSEIKINYSKNRLSISNEVQIELSKEELDHLFDKFFKVDSSRSEQGYGIGLSVVKAICDAHGWKVKPSSKGKEFILSMKFT